MKKATLTRADSTDQGTAGILIFDASVLHTIELPSRNNKPQISSIPEGIYQLLWLRSPTHGWLYHVCNVPNRAGVLIHAANFAGDTALGFDSQLKGCIALCQKIGKLRNKSGVMQLAGLISKPAVSAFESWGNKEQIQLEITS